MHTWRVRNDCLPCNGVWVITNLPHLEKSCPRDLKEAEVREDINVIWSRIHRSRILWLVKVTLRVIGQGCLAKESALHTNWYRE